MEAKTETKVVSVTLTMTQEEAEWLKDVMQNPFCEDCGREDEETKHMREKFFSTLATVWPRGLPVKEPPQPRLRPCPNCGESDPKKIVHVCRLKSDAWNWKWGIHSYENKYEHFVECSSCKVRGQVIINDSSTRPANLFDTWGTV